MCLPCDERLLEVCGAYEEMHLLQGWCTPVNKFMANLLCQGPGGAVGGAKIQAFKHQNLVSHE